LGESKEKKGVSKPTKNKNKEDPDLVEIIVHIVVISKLF
jgi:hypothetical protein